MYRAEVLSELDNEINIRYIDYGNCEKKPKNELLELPTSLITMPPFSWHVTLTTMSGIENTDENLMRLDELLMNDGIILIMNTENAGELTIAGNKIEPSLFPTSSSKPDKVTIRCMALILLLRLQYVYLALLCIQVLSSQGRDPDATMNLRLSAVI